MRELQEPEGHGHLLQVGPHVRGVHQAIRRPELCRVGQDRVYPKHTEPQLDDKGQNCLSLRGAATYAICSV